MSEAKPTNGLLHNAQVFALNAKHGWFEFGDAQGDVSLAFAADAIAEYERVRNEATAICVQTGLTPSQLVERVKELEAVVRALIAYDESDHEDGVQMMLDYADMLKGAYAALSKARPNTAEGEAAQQAPAAERENLELRRMLCIAHAGAAAYMDDGEAQDNRELPLIDFLHDTPAEIQDKLQRRALKKLAMTTEATTARWPSYEVAVSDPVFQVARSIMGTENMGQDRQLVAAINHVLAAAPTPAAAKEPSP